MKFWADAMLGKLARWLRILGYDTLYQKHRSGTDIGLQASQSGRLLLTRDTTLFAALPPDTALFIESDHLEAQLLQVARACSLDLSEAVLTRCPECNAVLERVAKADVAGRVPDFVYHTHADFACCPHCGRVYWKGTHQADMLARITRLASSGQDSQHFG
jgi:uncharacterized protein